ncbi:unnamed protein product [Sphagnum troendelagicum]
MSRIHHHVRPPHLLPIQNRKLPQLLLNLQVPRCSSSSSDTAGAKASGTTAAGQVQRLVLSNQGRSKLNPASDRGFYSSPRLVTHVDDHFLASLSALYRARIPENAEILDLMSSWISHLPEERKYKRVVGHGLNAVELARNSRLDHFFVKDLNAEPKLENADCSFDAVLCAVSVQYLEQPEKVFAEIFRVLRPGGVCIMSFSNRMFYEKAVSAWRDGSDYSRTQLVVQYFQCVAGFTQPEVIKQVLPITSAPAEESQQRKGSLFAWFQRLLQTGGGGRDPFFAVIAYRNFKPIE